MGAGGRGCKFSPNIQYRAGEQDAKLPFVCLPTEPGCPGISSPSRLRPGRSRARLRGEEMPAAQPPWQNLTRPPRERGVPWRGKGVGGRETPAWGGVLGPGRAGVQINCNPRKLQELLFPKQDSLCAACPPDTHPNTFFRFARDSARKDLFAKALR